MPPKAKKTAKKAPAPVKKAAKRAPTRKPGAAGLTTLSQIAAHGVSVGSRGTALNTAQAIHQLLLSIKPNSMSPGAIAAQLELPIGIVTNDLIFLIGVGLVTPAPNNPAEFVAV